VTAPEPDRELEGDDQLAEVLALFDLWARDINSVPFKHQDFWTPEQVTR
jgi:hypothetical protein